MNFDNTEIFYHPFESSSNSLIFSKEESIHVIKVLRLKENDLVTVINGKGSKILGEIIDPNSKSTKIKIIKRVASRPKISNKIHIAISPTKNINRFEWFIEKSIELGLSEITPILTLHSERSKLNYERLIKKMITALKQSKNLYLPKLNPIINFQNFIKTKHQAQKFICHNENKNNHYLKDKLIKGQKYLILIGPEGGFSSDEVKIAENNGFEQVLLGDSRYRTETAGILSCHTIHLFAT